MTRVGLTQRVSVVKEYGERRDCLDQQWTVLLKQLGYIPVPLPNRIDSVAAYLDELALDAIILTSGNDLTSVDDPAALASERDCFETAVLEYAIDHDIPVLGVCRGLELVNEYFGGELTATTDHVACTHQIDFTNDTAETEVDFPDMTTVNSYHNYGIGHNDVGEELLVLGTAPDETVECVVHESHLIWGIMWHPERESPSSDLDRQILTHALEGEH